MNFYFTEMCFGPSKGNSGFKIGMLSIGPIFWGKLVNFYNEVNADKKEVFLVRLLRSY